VEHPLHARCMICGTFCFSTQKEAEVSDVCHLGLSVSLLKKKLKFQHNDFNVQEQGMGGTVYDRDTIMKKYMNGYDGKKLTSEAHLRCCHKERT